jgi:TolB-like protein/DNA-binding winged helix-turn-helix (wHTH) protein/tetratricopeptide (TPR) repeat protein
MPAPHPPTSGGSVLAPQPAPQEFRFREYSLRADSAELRRAGTLVKLQPQPARVLAILVSRAGEVVMRQELAEQVWGSGTYVDFEHGLNFAIQQVRSVLDDDPRAPRFVETIPKRGYRFIAPVTREAPKVGREEQPDVEPRAPRPPRSARPWLASIAAVLVVFAVVIAAAVLNVRHSEVEFTPAAGIHSIAVLPLQSLSSDPEQAYFSDGMTDELITDLARSSSVRVISRTSVERYKGTRLALGEIAKQLNVDAVVEGTIMRSDGRVRITAQLIDAHSDRHLWADSYERDLRDVFTLQAEVARQIAVEIGSSLMPEGQPPARAMRPIDPAVHEAYMRGNFYWNQLTCDGFAKAAQYFQQTIDRDPAFARAYVGLAQSYFTLSDWGCSSDRALVAKSKVAALKAVALDPSSGEAHAWLGKLAFFYEWDFARAEHELTQAIELSPNYPEGHIIYAVFLETTGRREAGLAEMKRAHDIDPISQLTNLIEVVVFYLARDYDAAIEQGEKTVDLYSQSVGTYAWLGPAYEKRASYDRAMAAYLKAMELGGASSAKISASRAAYRKSGMRGYWQAELADAGQAPRADACRFATIYAHLGDKDRAVEYLEQSAAQHCSGPHTTLADPAFDSFRTDPRFKELLRRLAVPNGNDAEKFDR